MTLYRFRDKKGNIHEIWLRDGYTPVKGKDYFTPEEVADIIAQAVEQVQVGIAPTLLPSDSWYTGKTETAKSAFTEIRIVDRYTPTGAETEKWNADVEDLGKIRCYVEGTILTIAGNGSGRIMANEDSSKLFVSFTAVTTISGLELLDMRNVKTLRNALANLQSLTSVKGTEGWNVSMCESFYQFMTSDGCVKGLVDFSGWDVSRAVAIARADTEGTLLPFKYMVANCSTMGAIALNKTFDLSFFFLPTPYETDTSTVPGAWMEEESGQIVSDNGGDSMFEVEDGLLNPCVEGRNITYVAVFEETEVDI